MSVHTYILAVLLTWTCIAARFVPPSDPMYKEKRGKTYDELLATDNYIPVGAFGHLSDTAWKDHSSVHAHPHTLERRNQITGENVAFLLYKPNAPYGRELSQNVTEIKRFGWNPAWSLKVVIHGFRGDRTKDMVNEIKDAYLEARTPANVVAVDWGAYSGAGTLWSVFEYETVAERVDPIGDIIGEYVLFLRKAGLVKSLANVHVVGHSLGAHIAGRVGDFLKSNYPREKLGRISGLDPAGPSFYQSHESERLDAGDAAFVDVIHTNMGDLDALHGPITFGTPDRSGHADFYPNGGEDQPDCMWSWKTIGGLIGTCAHNKAWEYFAASIRREHKYKACRCGSWRRYEKGRCEDECDHSNVVMGEYCKPGTNGEFYLETWAWDD